MNTDIKSRIMVALAESLDIPDSAYEAAVKRYRDLGEWMSDKSKAKCAQYNPHIGPQGSFRLGTTTKPWKREDYDLDLSCKLQDGLTKTGCTQEQLKELVRVDLNAYREERGIDEKLEEKQRCWRLYYQDHLEFHMDTVPSIPQNESTRRILQKRMIEAGSSEALAQDVSELAMAITDNKHPSYRVISEDWSVSNPEGYAKWFESRMRLAQQFMESRALMAKVAKVDDLPVYKWKTPLQRAVQILKRHRDVMFERDPEGKPISIIITTLAAAAYGGESDIQSALQHILAEMGHLVNPSSPRVPNPVNPDEDFADKWATADGRRLRLQQKFELWLAQAQSDFDIVTSSLDKEFLGEQAVLKFGAPLDEKTLVAILGGAPSVITTPKTHHVSAAAKPWCNG